MTHSKKIVIAFFSITFLIFGACQQVPKKEKTETDKDKPTKDEPILPPDGIISLEESKSLYDNYTEHRVDMIEQYEAERRSDEKFIPARFTSFSYSDIKDYMAYIEQEAKGAGVEVSSLRLYFANYPDQTDFPDGKKIVHPRQNSIFIVPTTIMDGKESGFYIDANGKAKPIKNVVGNMQTGSSDEASTSQASFAPTLFQGDDTSLNLNHGGSGPPPDGDF